MIQHLRTQLTEAQEELEQMSILKIKEAAHLTQIEKLQQELREAKKHHSPVSLFSLSFIKTNITKKHVQNKFKAKYFNHKLVNKLPFTFNSERKR